MTKAIYEKYEKLYNELTEKYWIGVLSISHIVKILKLFEKKNKALLW
jgi:hypothetical protein